jgi:hypothetical protein
MGKAHVWASAGRAGEKERAVGDQSALMPEERTSQLGRIMLEVDRLLLLIRGVEPQCDVTPWLRKLDPSRALPEWIFEHCVSPSPRGGAIRVTTRCTPRKSQPKSYPPLWNDRQASLEDHIKARTFETNRAGVLLGDPCE